MGASDTLFDDLAQAARCQIVLAVRRTGVTSSRYIRRVIQNAIRSVIRRERRGLGLYSGRLVAVPDDIPAAPDESPDDSMTRRVIVWLATLPAKLQNIYFLLYERNLTQRDAARLLGVSQPRVAQLHAALLTQGRTAMTAHTA